VANNAVAWFVFRISARPPDRDHPYGHRKFETLAVFVLATLLTVLGVELALGAR
jgi:divalent metal cation (Fe/Co/Zn/Cd) transporter